MRTPLFLLRISQCVIFITAIFLTSASEKPATRSVIRSGIYLVTGDGPTGSYEGVATIRKNVDSWIVISHSGSTSTIGVGLFKDGKLSVGWSSGPTLRGVSVYEVIPDGGGLTGRWTVGDEVYKEKMELLREFK